jgi:hypothetical protein
VRVESDLTLSGSVAQHARGAGLVKEMAQQLSGQFAKNLAGVIATGRPGELTSPGSSDASPRSPQAATAVSGVALLFASIRAVVRRWFSR